MDDDENSDDEILRESMDNKRINQLICDNKFIIFK